MKVPSENCKQLDEQRIPTVSLGADKKTQMKVPDKDNEAIYVVRHERLDGKINPGYRTPESHERLGCFLEDASDNEDENTAKSDASSTDSGSENYPADDNQDPNDVVGTDHGWANAVKTMETNEISISHETVRVITTRMISQTLISTMFSNIYPKITQQ